MTAAQPERPVEPTGPDIDLFGTAAALGARDSGRSGVAGYLGAERRAARRRPVLPAPAQPAAAPERERAPWRSGWIALGITVVARAVLTMLLSLLVWSVVPVAIGWNPTVVMTASMAPRLHPGDVVISRPVAASSLQIGQVLLVADPDHPGRLRLHRLVARRPDGTLTLRGDANSADDSSPVAPSAVHGVGALRVPAIGLPMLWARSQNLPAIAAVLAGLLALCLSAIAFGQVMTTVPIPVRPAGTNLHRLTALPACPVGLGCPVGLVCPVGHGSARRACSSP